MTRTVTLPMSAPQDIARVRGVLASLPVDFRESATDPADLRVVSGSGTWSNGVRAALRDGYTTVVALDPGVQDAAEVRRLGDDVDVAGATVVLAERFAGNPVFSLLEPAHLPAELLTVNALLLSDDSTDRRDSFLELLRVLRKLGLQAEFDAVTRQNRALLVSGRIGRAPVTLIACDGPSTEMQVDVTGSDRELSLTLFSADTARPAQAISSAAEGGTLIPTLYETAYRAAFRSINQTPAGGQALRTLAEDIETVERRWRQ